MEEQSKKEVKKLKQQANQHVDSRNISIDKSLLIDISDIIKNVKISDIEKFGLYNYLKENILDYVYILKSQEQEFVIPIKLLDCILFILSEMSVEHSFDLYCKIKDLIDRIKN